MILKYDIEIEDNVIRNEIKKIINQIYKLLPIREEGIDWIKPLETILEEISGMAILFSQQDLLFPLICKLAGLFQLTREDDFMLYRRIIFECLGLLKEISKQLCLD